MRRAWLILIGCFALQLLLARVMPSPWWVPDLLAAGLVVAILRVPSWWMIFSAFAACGTVLWSVRHTAPLFMMWILLGGALRLLIDRWDIEALRVQMVAVGVVSLAIMAGSAWMDDVWSLELAGWMALRAILTALVLPMMRQRPA